MVGISFLVLIAVTGLSQSSAPMLHIKSVIPRSEGTAGSSMCTLQIANSHTRPAIAWVLELLPLRGEGTSNDFALAPGAWLAPAHEMPVTFPCQVGEVPAVGVAAVLYDDGTTAGDQRTLNDRVLRPRFKRAAGLRQLSRLLQGARLGGNPASFPKELNSLIEASSGPDIDPLVRAEAKRAASRILPRIQASADYSPDSVKTAVLTEIARSIRALEAVPLLGVMK